MGEGLTQSKDTGVFTWHEADLFCLCSRGLKACDMLNDLWEVKHGHLQTWVLPGKLVGQGTRAACGLQTHTLRSDPPSAQETLGGSPEFNLSKTKMMF